MNRHPARRSCSQRGTSDAAGAIRTTPSCTSRQRIEITPLPGLASGGPDPRAHLASGGPVLGAGDGEGSYYVSSRRSSTDDEGDNWAIFGA